MNCGLTPLIMLWPLSAQKACRPARPPSETMMPAGREGGGEWGGGIRGGGRGLVVSRRMPNAAAGQAEAHHTGNPGPPPDPAPRPRPQLPPPAAGSQLASPCHEPCSDDCIVLVWYITLTALGLPEPPRAAAQQVLGKAQLTDVAQQREDEEWAGVGVAAGAAGLAAGDEAEEVAHLQGCPGR